MDSAIIFGIAFWLIGVRLVLQSHRYGSKLLAVAAALVFICGGLAFTARAYLPDLMSQMYIVAGTLFTISVILIMVEEWCWKRRVVNDKRCGKGP